MTRDDIRIRIMQEALDCADRGETEAYNSIKVMCSDVLQMVEILIETEREACALVAESYEPTCESCPSGVANAIRARGKP